MPFLKRFSIIDRKRSPDKWLKDIQHTSQGLLPVPASNDDTLFPWAQLRLHTGVYLSKRSLSEVERDQALRKLIESCSDKVVGLAACSRHLSAKALLEVLQTFEGNAALFLQAFVAASHGNTEIFSPQDEAWATVLARIAGDQYGTPSVSAIRLLLNKWCTPPLPAYAFLRNVGREMTLDFLQKMNETLEGCLVRKDWNQAIELSACLSDISSRISQELLDILDWEFSQWRQWVAWKPSRNRLLLWRPHKTFPLMQPFWNALGPDFMPGHPFDTAFARSTTRGQLVEWMQINGLKPGFDIICCDSVELVPFTSSLLNVLDLSCRLGSVARDLLQYIAFSKEGLCRFSLKMWEDATTSLLPRSERFLDALLTSFNSAAGLLDDRTYGWLDSGLSDLSAAGTRDLRDVLQPKIEDLVRQMVVSLRFDFATAVNTDSQWLETAEKITILRTLLMKFNSTYDFQDMGVNIKQQADSTDLAILQELHTDIRMNSTDQSLHAAAQVYITHAVLGTDHGQDDRLLLIADLLKLWQPIYRITHCGVALALASLVGISPALRRDLVGGIHILSAKQASKLESCLRDFLFIDLLQLCYRIVRIAARILTTYPATSPAWQAVVRHVMAVNATLPPDDIHFSAVRFKKYRNWIKNYHIVFENTNKGRRWVDRLAEYSDLIDTIGSMKSPSKAVPCIYAASEEPHSTHVLQMLGAIKKEHDVEREAVMRCTVLGLTDNRQCSQCVSQTVLCLAKIPNEGFQQCKRLIIIAAQESGSVAAVQKDVWLGLPSNPDTKRALNLMAEVLRLPSTAKPETAKDFFMRRIAQVVKEARAVEDMRVKISRMDRKGVAAVLTTLMIEEQGSVVGEEIMDLPSDLQSVVEQVDESTVELSFPLSYMSFTQRRAWGLATDENIVVRLSIGDNGNRTAFCVHVVDPHADMSLLKHDPLEHGKTTNPPNTMRCEGRITRLTYMIMRSLWHWLVQDDAMTLAHIYGKIDGLIRTARNNCVVCNQSHPTPAKTYRPSVCIKPGCRATWLQSALELRLVDLRMDEDVVEMLLAAIHAAANTMSKSTKTDLELLPGRPPRLNVVKQLLTLMDKIPNISTTLNTLDSLYSIRTKYGIRTELLLSWATNNHRAFLTSAPPALQIPNMPGAKQFVVADSPPEIVAAFAQHDALQPRQVLFHGTTMDRLYAILCQGLKILSNTAFQSHGAAYGTGIYLAENPATAVSYSAVCASSSAVWTANHPSFVDNKVLLGIEYAGNDVGRGGGIHVATDPTKLLLRYVFLLPKGFKAPVAAHVVPAIQSNMATLKSGVRAT